MTSKKEYCIIPLPLAANGNLKFLVFFANTKNKAQYEIKIRRPDQKHKTIPPAGTLLSFVCLPKHAEPTIGKFDRYTFSVLLSFNSGTDPCYLWICTSAYFTTWKRV